MIPILYESIETQFASNGIGRLTDCTMCEVTEERNGIFECKFEYPTSGKYYDELKTGRIVSVIHDDTKTRQPFVIYRYTAPINGLVTFYAHHISYELSNIILSPYEASGVVMTLEGIPGHSTPSNRYQFWTDKTTQGNFSLKVPKAVRQVLGGSAGSVLDTFGGGEYEFDKFTVKLYQNRGVDNNVTIRYGKNLISISDNYDVSGSYNSVAPYWANDETVVMLPEFILVGPDMSGDTADWVDADGNYITDENGNHIVFGGSNIVAAPLDLSGEFEDAPTVGQLRTKANQVFNRRQPWEPSRNIKVDFIALWQTTEYKDYAVLQRVNLCDTVGVIYPDLGVNVKKKVIKTVYNVLTERYNSIELGTASTNLYQAMTSGLSEKIEDATKHLPTKGYLDAAIEYATKMITGGLGGYVVFTMNANGQPEEILIMDTPDTSTAVNVWRFNKNGLGHSHNGYNGPFSDIALTADGKINANMITTGVLNANLIRAGVITDQNATSYWNLNNGEFSFSGDLHIKKGSTIMDITNISYPEVSWDSNFNVTVTNKTSTGLKIRTQAGNNKDSSIEFPIVNKTYNGATYSMLPEIKERYTGFADDRNIDTDISSGVKYIHVYGAGSKYYDYCLKESAASDGFIYRLDYGSDGFHYTPSVTNGGWISIDADPMGYSSVSSSTIVPFIALKAMKGTRTGAGSLNLSNSVTMEIRPEKFLIKAFYSGVPSSQYMLDLDKAAKVVITSSAATINGKTVAYTSTSSRRYKEDIKALEAPELDPHRLYDLPVRQFKYHDGMILQYDDMAGQLLPGFIAEEVEQIYPAAAIHDTETGRVESWDERRIIPGLLALVQEQKETIDRLQQRLDALEARINALEG